MPEPTNGTPVQPEQVLTGTQVAPDNSQQQSEPLAPNPAQQSAEPTQTPPADPAAAIRAEFEQRLQQAEQSARYHQSRADQTLNQLRAVTGVTPESDPLDSYVKNLTSRYPELDDKAARILAEDRYSYDQRLNQMQTAFMSQAQLPSVINQVCAGNPALASVSQQLYGEIQQEVARGNVNATNPEYIKTIGARLYLDSMSNQRGQAPIQVPQPIPQFGSQFGPISGYQPQQAPPQQNGVPQHLKAYADAEKAEVLRRHNIQPPQQ